MEIDTTFPTKLDTISDAPEPLRSALVEGLPAGESARLLVHSPAFPTGDKKSPATVLAVTDSGWLVASETDDGGSALQKSAFSDILFLELRSILLLGQLRISFAAIDAPSSVTIEFEGVGDELYREAIDLMLAGVDPSVTGVPEQDRNEAAIFEDWPMKFRNEAHRYCPRGQRLLAAVRWPAVFGEFHHEISAAGALLITQRELVLISDEKESSTESLPETYSAEEPKERPPEQQTSPAERLPETEKTDLDPRNLPGDAYEFGEIITFVPRVRLEGLHVSHRERFGVLVLQVHAAHGREKLEILFPPDHETAVSKALEQVSLFRSSETKIISE
jgi:hypothetical protein